MFRFAQFATGRIRRGGHDRVGYDMLSARASIAPQKRLVRNLRRRGLFPDVDQDYRNRARARGH